jgi:hypothetical protein
MQFIRTFCKSSGVVLGSPILVTLVMEALGSSEASVLAGAALCGISEDAVLHGHCRESLRSYIPKILYGSVQFSSTVRCWVVLRLYSKTVHCVSHPPGASVSFRALLLLLLT